jgi:cellobiose transport system permease protein
MQRKSVSYEKYGYIFSVPFMAAFAIFAAWPLIYTVIIGFTDLRGMGKTVYHFLPKAFDNFRLILANPSFQKSLYTTALLWVMNFIPQIVLAFVLAAWFTDRRFKVKGQGLFKILIYMPNIITAASIAILFNVLFGYPKGPINDILINLGIYAEPRNFTLMKWNARSVVAFIQFWMWYGNTMIVLIAGIMGINPSLFESAEIDGATASQTFFRITLPAVRTILLYTLVTSLIGGMQMFDIPRLYLLGGPDQATATTTVFIYNQAFSGSYLYNRAAAASLILFLIIAVLSSFVFFLLRDKEAIKQEKQRKAFIKEAKRKAKLAAGSASK